MLLSADPNTHMQTPEGPAIGDIVAERYRILDVAGQGGMGVVYKAEHVHISRVLALKMLLKEAANDEQAFKRFQQEARAVSLLHHPHIVAIHDFGVLQNKQAYLTMDFLDGRSLNQEIRQTMGLPLDRFKHIFVQACDGLAHAHKQGVVHRDIKPSNFILIDRDGDHDFLMIVDFGLVKLMTMKDEKLTSTDVLLGSPLYMSPEQCRGLEMDHRTDIYSLGCVMYEALCGRAPLLGESPLDTLYKHVATMPPPFKDVRPDLEVPRALQEVVFKALAKKPEGRQQSMEQLQAEIEAALPVTACGSLARTASSAAPLPIVTNSAQIIKPARPQPRPTKKTNNLWWLAPVLGVALVFLLIIASLFKLLSVNQQLEKEIAATSAKAAFAAAPAPASNVSNDSAQPVVQPGQPHGVQTPHKHANAKAAAKSDSARIKPVIKKADDSYEQGNYQAARSLYQQALAMEQKAFGTEAKPELPVLAMLIVCNSQLGDESAVVQYLNQFSDLYPAYRDTIFSDWQLLQDLSEITAKRDDHKLAETLLSDCIRSHDAQVKPPNADSLKLRLKLAELFRSSGDPDRAKQLFREVGQSDLPFPRLRQMGQTRFAELGGSYVDRRPRFRDRPYGYRQ